MAKFINITVNQFQVHPNLIFNFIKKSSVVLVYQTAFDHNIKMDYNLMNICMVAIHLDKTGIISQTNIIGIKCEGFQGFKLTD